MGRVKEHYSEQINEAYQGCEEDMQEFYAMQTINEAVDLVVNDTRLLNYFIKEIYKRRL